MKFKSDVDVEAGLLVSGNVGMASGNAVGKFAVKSAGVHASYDFLMTVQVILMAQLQ